MFSDKILMSLGISSPSSGKTNSRSPPYFSGTKHCEQSVKSPGLGPFSFGKSLPSGFIPTTLHSSSTLSAVTMSSLARQFGQVEIMVRSGTSRRSDCSYHSTGSEFHLP